MKAEKISRAVCYVITFIFGAIVFYLTITRMFSYCSINNREVTSYNTDNVILNIGIIFFFTLSICIIKYISVKYITLNKFRIIVENKIYKILFVLLLLFGTWIVVSTQLWPKADQQSVLAIASQLRSHDYAPWQTGGYMSRYPNQNGYVFFIYVMSKIIGDYNNIGLQLINVAALAGIYYYMTGLCKELKRSTLVMLCMFLPLALYVTFVYGTLLGLFLSVAALYYQNKYFEKNKLYLYVISVLFITAAVIIKNNYIIFFIAMVIFLMIHSLYAKKWLPALLSIGMILIYFLISSGFDYAVETKTGGSVKQGMPAQAWIAMGMQEGNRASGWFNAYHEGVLLHNGNDVDATREEVIEDIHLRMNEFAEDKKEMFAFYSRKIASQWNNPDFEAFWNHTNRESKIFMSGASQKVISGGGIIDFYLKCFHLLVLAGTSICLLFHYKKYNIYDLRYAVIFIGGFLFHLIWEAKCQYTIVYFVLLIPYAVKGFSDISDLLMKKIGYKKQMGESFKS